jgi:hypothetical protein
MPDAEEQRMPQGQTTITSHRTTPVRLYAGVILLAAGIQSGIGAWLSETPLSQRLLAGAAVATTLLGLALCLIGPRRAG